MSAKIYTDKYTGKQYRVLDGYSAKVVQYAAGVTIYFDGSCQKGGRLSETNFKTRARLNSWLRMMKFK